MDEKQKEPPAQAPEGYVFNSGGNKAILEKVKENG
jgi:hypothetical protein